MASTQQPKTTRSARAPQQTKLAYRETFVNFEPGRSVLNDLEHVVRKAHVDARDINPHNAVYRCAQEDLLRYIKNQIEKENDDRIIAGNPNTNINKRRDEQPDTIIVGIDPRDA